MKKTEIPFAEIVILTPGHSVTQPYLKSLMSLIGCLNEKKISWAFSNEFSSHVGDAREITLSGTRENRLDENRPFHGNLNYNKLMWIDSDITFTPEDVMKLYESDKDIVTGAYLLSNGDAAVYPKKLKGAYSYEQVQVMTELTEVSGAGFGFICIKQGVFETLSRPWFQSAMTSHTINEVKYDFAIMGEDLSWCERVKEKGFTIWFDPSVKVIHNKIMQLTWEGVRP